MIRAVIQARLGSTRLPGKVLKRLGHYTALEQVVRRVLQVPSIDEVIIAIPIDERLKWADMIVSQELKLFYPRLHWAVGPMDDVLARHCIAAGDADHMVRVTSDCPLADANFIEAMIQHHLSEDNDFTFYLGNVHGLQAEVFSNEGLGVSQMMAEDESHREHVSDWIIEEGVGHGLKVGVAPLPHYEPDEPVRLTLDTPADYDLLSELFDTLGDNTNMEGAVEWTRRAR